MSQVVHVLALTLHFLGWLWSNATVQNAVRGAEITAGPFLYADFLAFKACHSKDEFITYDWKVARWQLMQAIIAGAISGSGLGAVFGWTM